MSNLNSNEKDPSCTENLWYYLSQYCAATSIHGIQYIGERGRFIVERILWSTILLILSYFCIFMICQTYAKWQTSPVIVNFATTETPIWEIPFPAITICSEVKTNPEFFNFTDIYLKKFIHNENITEEEEMYLRDILLICEENSVLGTATNRELIVNETVFENILLLFMTTISNISFSAIWHEKELEYSLIYTEEGICLSYNMLSSSEIMPNPHNFNKSSKEMINQWNIEDGYSKDANHDAIPRRTFVAGLNGGLHVQLMTNDSFLTYMCGNGLLGFKAVIHHPLELPDFSKHFRVPLDQYVAIGVKPRMITVSENLKNYSPHKRNCYFSDQRPLKYFLKYTQNNCFIECLSNYTLQICNCIPFYMPRDLYMPICGLGSKDCVSMCKVNIGKNISSKTNSNNCDCLPSCTSLEYDIEISQSSWNFWEYFLILEKKLGIKIPMFDFEKDHISYLRVYYKERYFMTAERHELYGYVDFFSNTGGLLGLFVGVSVTSAIEILYFLTLRLFCNIKKYGKKFWSGDPEMVSHDTEEES